MSAMASSSLNPNAPLFIPAAYRQVEDFSPQWWDLVHTTAWFRDHVSRQHQRLHEETQLPDDDDDLFYAPDHHLFVSQYQEDQEQQQQPSDAVLRTLNLNLAMWEPQQPSTRHVQAAQQQQHVAGVTADAARRFIHQHAR